MNFNFCSCRLAFDFKSQTQNFLFPHTLEFNSKLFNFISLPLFFFLSQIHPAKCWLRIPTTAIRITFIICTAAIATAVITCRISSSSSTRNSNTIRSSSSSSNNCRFRPNERTPQRIRTAAWTWITTTSCPPVWTMAMISAIWRGRVKFEGECSDNPLSRSNRIYPLSGY